MRLLKCFYRSVSYLWSDVSLPFRTAPPSRPPQPLGSFLPPKSRAAWLVSTLFWEPSHHAHGYFSSKFISSYLYESLLCQLVCIAYFDYKIKYLNSSVFHHHHHHPLLHPSFWLVGAKGWVFSQVPQMAARRNLWQVQSHGCFYHFRSSVLCVGQITALPTRLSIG